MAMDILSYSGVRVGSRINVANVGECVVTRNNPSRGPYGKLTLRCVATRAIIELDCARPLESEAIGGPKTDAEECAEIVKLECESPPYGVSLERWRAVLLAACEGQIVDGRADPFWLQSIADVARKVFHFANRP